MWDNRVMASRKIPFVDGEYYHIYNRGNSKQKIFLDDEDYKHFVQCLFLANSYRNFKFRDNVVDLKIDAFDFKRGDLLVSIGAWVLMPNHFHIYLTPAEVPSHKSDMWEGKNNVVEFMRKLSTAYAKYFNGKYSRSGSLFEGAFKATHVEVDTHAKYLFSYIHLNPLKLLNPKWKEDGIGDISLAKEFLKKYQWSSYPDYLDLERVQEKIISPKKFPPYFTDRNSMHKEIFEWISFPHVGHVGDRKRKK